MLPRRIVGFGSVAGRFGNLAQIDYSAANDGLAHMLRWADREMDAKASIIDWAPWSQIGMATRGSVQLTLEAAGIDFVSPQQGIEFLFREVGRTTSAKEVMAAGRMGPFTPDAFEIPGAEPPADLQLAGHQARIENIIPGEYVRAHISLDPSRPLLDHHRIDRAAVLPGVGGMAIMKAAAALLNPQMGSANFEKVRFISPLKIFKNEPFEAEVEVIRVPEVAEGTIAYDARITSRFVDKLGRKMGSPRLHHQCRVVLGSSGQATLPDVADWGQSVRIAEQDIYAIFFHGPGFRFLDHVALEGSGKAVRFRYRDTEHRKAMFSDMIPGAVEAAFQAAAALGLESKSVMALPVGIDRAEIFSTESMPYEGELIPVAQTVLDGPEERMVFRFDGVIRNSYGEPIIILKGVEAVELERSNGFPRRVFEEIVAIDRGGTAPDGKNPLADALDEEEAREHAEKKVPKRAEEWLSGRVALKKSVGRLLATTAGEAPPLRHVRIVQTDLGKPAAELSHRPGVTVAEVSLSHSNGLAMAAAASPGLFEGLGVDVEKVEARSEGWIGDYFSKDEIRLAGKGEERWTRLTMIWCLKEAALKAMGTGLRFDLKDINVADINPAGRATLEFHNEAARYVDERFHGAFEASVEEKGGIARARVLIRK
jgi:phosphopantetheinyl transferase (holo-ACP synthase)